MGIGQGRIGADGSFQCPSGRRGLTEGQQRIAEIVPGLGRGWIQLHGPLKVSTGLARLVATQADQTLGEIEHAGAYIFGVSGDAQSAELEDFVCRVLFKQ